LAQAFVPVEAADFAETIHQRARGEVDLHPWVVEGEDGGYVSAGNGIEHAADDLDVLLRHQRSISL
jgi:hypothetical protein